MFSQPRILKEGDETPGVQKTSKSINSFFGMWEQRKDVAGKDVSSPFKTSLGERILIQKKCSFDFQNGAE